MDGRRDKDRLLAAIREAIADYEAVAEEQRRQIRQNEELRSQLESLLSDSAAATREREGKGERVLKSINTADAYDRLTEREVAEVVPVAARKIAESVDGRADDNGTTDQRTVAISCVFLWETSRKHPRCLCSVPAMQSAGLSRLFATHGASELLSQNALTEEEMLSVATALEAISSSASLAPQRHVLESAPEEDEPPKRRSRI